MSIYGFKLFTGFILPGYLKWFFFSEKIRQTIPIKFISPLPVGFITRMSHKSVLHFLSKWILKLFTFKKCRIVDSAGLRVICPGFPLFNLEPYFFVISFLIFTIFEKPLVTSESTVSWRYQSFICGWVLLFQVVA